MWFLDVNSQPLICLALAFKVCNCIGQHDRELLQPRPLSMSYIVSKGLWPDGHHIDGKPGNMNDLFIFRAQSNENILREIDGGGSYISIPSTTEPIKLNNSPINQWDREVIEILSDH